jgi:Flp pilus assembly protein TadG
MLLKFLRDHRGSILPTFALIVVPLLVSTGAVVDYTNAYDQRSLVQDALDSAALAAGKQVGVMTTDELKAEAEAFYLANIGTGKISNIPTINTEINGTTVDVDTTLHVPTYFLGLIGLDEFIFDLRAQVTIAMGTIEVAMVLDNSTSMCLNCDDVEQQDPDSKIGALRIAATNLATTLYGLGATSTKPDPVKIAVAPFAGSVNVGPGVTWVDKLGKATYAADSMESESGGASPTLNPYAYFATLKNADGTDEVWEGCVEERPAPHDVDDEPPSLAANPTSDEAKTLFLPMFAPDEPDGWTCATSGSDFCIFSGGSSSTRRFNGAPAGTQSYNNYLPDVGSGGMCGPDVTMTLASPAVFTSTAHGLSGGTEIQFQTTGSLYTGLSTSTLYYVSAAPAPTTNNFYLTAFSTPPTVTVTGSSSQTFTVTSANPAVFTRSSHGLTAGTAIQLSTTGDMYNPLNNNGVYYVISSGLSSNNFRVSTTSGGSAVSTSGGGTQSGTHSHRREALFTRNSHGVSVGNPVVFTTTGALPTGITANTIYFVRTVPSSSTFTVAATSGGAPIFITSAGSGTHTLHRLIVTSGTQSGTHTYTKVADWTCQNGSNCSGTGKTENVALAGVNISNDLQCKYGTVAQKATISATTIGGMEGGPNYMCTTQAVTPLTATEATVTGQIAAQLAYGYTNITAGIMWGWRLLSPTEPFTEGRAYTDNENDKIMIVMTDGENTYFPYSPGSNPTTYNNKFLHSAYGAWGYMYKQHLGIDTTNQATLYTTLNARTALACENVKAADIQVYTIAFQVNDAPTLQMLEECASDPSMAYQSGNNDELIAAFAAIGDDISLLRIAQ